MDTSTATIFQVGSTLPNISGAALFLQSRESVEKSEINVIKGSIMTILEKSKKVFVSDLAEKIGVPPSKIVLAVKELKKEGLIVDSD